MTSSIVDGPSGLIGFVTDLEGDLLLWNRYIEISQILHRRDDGSLELLEGSYLVYGGDVVDHGPGDLTILGDLVSLKLAYPERVHFVLGNRDVNKLRLPTELAASFRERWPLAKHPGVYWMGDTKTPAETLTEEEAATDTAVQHLKWILRDTMGAPKAFESRREELKRLQSQETIDGDAVVQSFLRYIEPGGLLYQYLSFAHLAVLVGDVLFVHAGLPRRSEQWTPGWLPGTVPRERVGLRDWVQGLAEFKDACLQKLKPLPAEENPPVLEEAWSMKGGYDHPQPGSALLQYMMRDMPDGSRQPSIIYNGWLGDDYQPLSLDDATLQWLREGGVRRVVSGHLPHGESPLVLRLGEDLSAITADISYASDVEWLGDKRSGGEETKSGGGECNAVCEVILGPDSKDGRIHGFLGNGLAFESCLDDPALGRVTSDGWRVKGRCNGQLLLSRNQQWSFQSRLAEEDCIELV